VDPLVRLDVFIRDIWLVALPTSKSLRVVAQKLVDCDILGSWHTVRNCNCAIGKQRWVWKPQENIQNAHPLGTILCPSTHFRLDQCNVRTRMMWHTCDRLLVRGCHKHGLAGQENVKQICKHLDNLTHVSAPGPFCTQYRKWLPPSIVSLHDPNAGLL